MKRDLHFFLQWRVTCQWWNKRGNMEMCFDLVHFKFTKEDLENHKQTFQLFLTCFAFIVASSEEEILSNKNLRCF
jgi:hypothetical protein